ncbi:pregnancy zone protein-like [Chrysemys picta bellii]|uniref:pregnancy zone protein-like n=1 Tax=Chrysemys picta bellii TaxID=8478 RepID=UPI0032B25186
MSLKLPENVVQGSARAYFSVLGDILGTAMQNLQQLLQMPFGCGEQNMVLFAPNIYVLDYLNKRGQLSEETKSKAIGYLVSGEKGRGFCFFTCSLPRLCWELFVSALLR